jgi:hypothetical protein
MVPEVVDVIKPLTGGSNQPNHPHPGEHEPAIQQPMHGTKDIIPKAPDWLDAVLPLCIQPTEDI